MEQERGSVGQWDQCLPVANTGPTVIYIWKSITLTSLLDLNKSICIVWCIHSHVSLCSGVWFGAFHRMTKQVYFAKLILRKNLWINKWCNVGVLLILSFFNHRVSILDNGSLRIWNVTKLDAGVYTCIARNQFGVASSTGTVTVKGISLCIRSLSLSQLIQQRPWQANQKTHVWNACLLTLDSKQTCAMFHSFVWKTKVKCLKPWIKNDQSRKVGQAFLKHPAASISPSSDKEHRDAAPSILLFSSETETRQSLLVFAEMWKQFSSLPRHMHVQRICSVKKSLCRLIIWVPVCVSALVLWLIILH